jgi:hypothetical protein
MAQAPHNFSHNIIHHQRIAGGNGFDFGEGERGVLEIFETNSEGELVKGLSSRR